MGNETTTDGTQTVADEYDLIVTEEAKKDPDWRAKAKTGWGNLSISPAPQARQRLFDPCEAMLHVFHRLLVLVPQDSGVIARHHADYGPAPGASDEVQLELVPGDVLELHFKKGVVAFRTLRIGHGPSPVGMRLERSDVGASSGAALSCGRRPS